MIFVRSIFLLLFFLIHLQVANAQNLLWSAGMENGNMSEWSLNGCGGEFNSGVSHSEASTDVALSGSYSAKMSIGTPSAPESGVRLFRWCESQRNQELYYSAWYFFPQHYVAPNWWSIMQWKSKTSSRNDPFFMLDIGNRSDGTMYPYLYDWQRRRSYGGAASIPVGRWFQVEAFYRCAADNTGRVTIWQDGQLVFDVSGLSTRYSDGDCEWAVINYSDRVDPDPTIIYADDAAIGISRIGSVITPTPTPTPTPAPAPPPSCRPKGKSGKCR
jgi:hypothetical protein